MSNKVIRSKAPLRIGLAGGGTDVSPYCDHYGGAVLNASINKYAYATIIPNNLGQIRLQSHDLGKEQILPSAKVLEVGDSLKLMKGVYNRVISDYDLDTLSFDLITHSDVPKGSGLGSSSTLTVAILGAFIEWLNLPLGKYDIAHLAHQIERNDLGMSGGKQDHYASTFGGVNFIEFEGKSVVVNPLNVKEEYLCELEFNTLLYHTGASRFSDGIIKDQISQFKNSKGVAISAAHEIKKIAYEMKELLLKGDIDKFGALLHRGWEYKKRLSNSITKDSIDEMYVTALKNGATGGKISGAGGGGFFVLCAPNNSKHKIINALKPYGGHFWTFGFTNTGLKTWTIEKA